MSNPLESLHEELRRAGVAPGRARRLVDELHDHVASHSSLANVGDADVVNRAHDAAIGRLGRTDDLVRAATIDRRNLCFARRWPRLVFGVIPPLLVLASVPAVAFMVISTIEAIEGIERLLNTSFGPAVTVRVAEVLRLVGQCVCASAIVVAYAWLGRRARCALFPPLGAALVAAILSSAVITGIDHTAPRSPNDLPFSYHVSFALRPVAGVPAVPRLEPIVALTTFACLTLAFAGARATDPRGAGPVEH
ncbi:MAG: hypothetical protein AB8G96_04955 [Phycisphaerales bacterium]